MELEKIFALLSRFDASSLSRLELELDDMKLTLEKGAPVGATAAPVPAPAAAPAAPEAAAAEPEGTLVTAPLVGVFYTAPAPGQAPFVSAGDRVERGQTLCVLEAMKMMSEVPSPVSGTVLEVLAADGDLVGFDAPLFRIRER